MSFRLKIGIAFSSILFLTIVVAVSGWWGMNQALGRQTALFSLHDTLESKLHQLLLQEQNFVSKGDLLYSRSILEILAEIQDMVQAMHLPADTSESQAAITNVLETLNQYKASFSAYTSSDVDMQTMKSRMLHESKRLLSNTESLSKIGVNVAAMLQLTNKALLAEKEYILSGQQETADEVTTSASLVAGMADAIETKTANSASRLTAFRISNVARIYLNIFNQFVSEKKRQGTALAAMQSALTQFKHEISAYIDQESAAGKAQIAAFKMLTLATSLLAILLSIIATITLSRIITLPIDQLKQSANRIVAGDLDTSVTITSHDEIGELGTIFNHMAQQLKKSFDETASYRDHLEELVKERTAELVAEIAERRQVENNLIDSEEKFKAFFDNASDGILIVDPNTRKYLAGNRKICRMLGYSAGELVTLGLEDTHPPHDYPHILEIFTKHCTNEITTTYDLPFLRKDETAFPAEISTAVFTIKNKKYLMAAIRDITERKIIEAELLKTRKLESVGVLAGGIAHDFNNILTAILGNISLAMAHIKPHDPIEALLEQVHKASLRARDLTQQLLTFSRGGEPVKKIASIVDIITDSASFILRGSKVKCEYHFAENLWPLEIDAGQISQVIQNIIVNASHAMPSGGIIHITGENIEAKDAALFLPVASDCIRIVIQDSGIGIQQKHLEKIFDPYFSTKQMGSGLGLAITHSIVTKHGGTISAASEPGTGATFTFYLPANKNAVVPEKKKTPRKPFHGRGTILVMDDEEIVQSVAKTILTQFGYDVVLANDGEEALRVYQGSLQGKCPIDLIIMDLTIPGGMGGAETIAKILALDSAAKVIVSSGYSNDPVMSSYKEYGFAGVINKPFQVHELIETVQAVAEQSP